ncbi:MAG TPA: transposase, partial [Pirellulales bacterium]|nr:transposase [Pirellulales bacterium]
MADKGYHADQTLELAGALGYTTYIPEPNHPHNRDWTNKPAGFREATINNRRRMRRTKGKQLQRARSERCERTFAHICDTGGSRRSWLRGIVNVT